MPQDFSGFVRYCRVFRGERPTEIQLHQQMSPAWAKRSEGIEASPGPKPGSPMKQALPKRFFTHRQQPLQNPLLAPNQSGPAL